VIKFISGIVWMKWQSATTNRFGAEGSGRYDFPNDTTGQLSSWSPTISNTSFSIVSLDKSATTQSAYVDGALAASQPNNGAMTAPSTQRFALGAEAGGFLGAAIEVKEIFILDSISTANRQIMEGYLAWKWGLQGNLPSNHPYKNSFVVPAP
jgi:hypothetical protein